MVIDEIMVLTPLEQDINALLYKAGYYLHTYRAIDALNVLAGYFLRDGRLEEAMKWADKALETVTEKELMAGPYQIKGGIAAAQGDYPKAIELLNQAAAYAEEAHCLTDLAMAISDLAAVYNEMGRMEIALSEMFRAERYAKDKNLSPGASTCV